MTILVGVPVALSSVVSLLLTWIAIRRLRTIAPRWGLVDVPNQRSSHRIPTPRAGGLGFVVVVPIVTVTTYLWIGSPIRPELLWLLLGGLLVAAVGLADDRWGLDPLPKLAAYLLAGGIAVLGGVQLHELQWPGGPSVWLGWAGIPLTLVWIVGLANAYNFMDGIDGIAAVQAVIASGTAAMLALALGGVQVAIPLGALAGGSLGFLLHNWPPARIFMGDVGSAFLGFTFAGVAVLSSNGAGASLPFALWLVLLAPFLFDTSLTLAMRVFRGERWYEAHHQHLYQRLVERGWSHRAVTSIYLCADLFLAGLAVALVAAGVGGPTLALGICLPLVGILALVKWVERKSTTSRLSRMVP